MCSVTQDGSYHFTQSDSTCSKWEERKLADTVIDVIPEHPKDLVWIEGELPEVKTVPYECCALIWVIHRKYKVFIRLETVKPWEDRLNSTRWDGDFTLNKQEYEVVRYAWLFKPKDSK